MGGCHDASLTNNVVSHSMLEYPRIETGLQPGMLLPVLLGLHARGSRQPSSLHAHVVDGEAACRAQSEQPCSCFTSGYALSTQMKCMCEHKVRLQLSPAEKGQLCTGNVQCQYRRARKSMTHQAELFFRTECKLNCQSLSVNVPEQF